HCTGVLGLTTSGVSTPMKRTRSTRRPILARMVSPSTTRTTIAWALDPGGGSAPTGEAATPPGADREAAGALVPHPLAASAAARAIRVTRRSNRIVKPPLRPPRAGGPAGRRRGHRRRREGRGPECARRGANWPDDQAKEAA